jgi:hypothetical protein
MVMIREMKRRDAKLGKLAKFESCVSRRLRRQLRRGRASFGNGIGRTSAKNPVNSRERGEKLGRAASFQLSFLVSVHGIHKQKSLGGT